LSAASISDTKLLPICAYKVSAQKQRNVSLINKLGAVTRSVKANAVPFRCYWENLMKKWQIRAIVTAVAAIVWIASADSNLSAINRVDNLINRLIQFSVLIEYILPEDEDEGDDEDD
jgi:hypothetical protein